MDDIIISMALAVVLGAIKNPAKKEKLRKALLKVFRAIKVAFPDDPDFE